jgi:hypothetical protein
VRRTRTPKTAAPGISPQPGAAQAAAKANGLPPYPEAAADEGTVRPALIQQAAPPPLSPPGDDGGAATGFTGEEWRKKAKQAISDSHRQQRRRRGKRPAKPITGVQWTPPGGGAA